MDVSAVQSQYGVTPGSPIAKNLPNGETGEVKNFGDVLNAAMNVVDETNTLQHTAQNEEVKFALGESDNTHDLLIAQQKALTALQYTVAIRDRFIQGYQEIMNMQI